MTPPTVALQVDAETLARALERHPDFRVLRRLRETDRPATRPGRAQEVECAVLAVRSTHPTTPEDELVELALQRIRLDGQGRVVATGSMWSWLEQPSRALPPPFTRRTGIAECDVAGRSIHEGEATSLLSEAEILFVHGSSETRPVVERRLPLAAGQAWVCARDDMDWTEHGLEGRSLPELAAETGSFHPPGRARADVAALVRLLDRPLDGGGTVAKRLIEAARKPTWRVNVPGAHKAARGVLRDRGYLFDAEGGAWSASVPADRLAEELSWASLMLFGGRRKIRAVRETWTDRHAGRLG